MSRKTSFWHPFADMAAVNGAELVLSRGKGCWIWDEAGNKYLDSTAGLWYCNVGYGRADLAEAAAAQMSTLSAYSAFGVYASRPALELAQRIAQLAPISDAAVFFTTCGSGAIDTATKLVRGYWQVIGEPRRQLIVAREGAYHGMCGYGTALGGISANSSGFGDLAPGVVHVGRDDLEELERILHDRGNQVAAFIGEPVIGAGGVYPPAEGYWQAVQELCRRHGVFLVLDEVVTGFGRLGSCFASERYGLEPDLIVFAKGVTSGYLPLGGVVCGSCVQEPFWSGNAGMLRHGYTYSGHATACAVGLANLDIIEREELVQRVADLEPRLRRSMAKLWNHPLVAEVRSEGLIAGVEFEQEALAEDPDLIPRVVAAAQDLGVLTRSLVNGALQISPPFVIEEREIDFLVETLWRAIEIAAKTYAPMTRATNA